MKSEATGCGSISTVFSSVVLLCVSSIMIIIAHQVVTATVQVCFSGEQNVLRPIIFDIVNFCYKLIMGKTGGLFVVLVECSVSYVLVKNLEREPNLVSSRFHLVVFVIGVNQEKWKAGEVQDYQHE